MTELPINEAHGPGHLITGISAGQRESATKVCRDKATRLRQRADAYGLLARLIEDAELTDGEEQKLWSLVAFND